MGQAEDLAELLVSYRRLHEQMARSISEQGVDWRKRYLALRREMASATVKFAAIAHDLEKNGVARPFVDQYQATFSAMRHRIALHQADWPVVSIDTASLLYQDSSARRGRAKRIPGNVRQDHRRSKT